MNVLSLLIHITGPMKKLITLLIYCFLVHFISYSQPYDPSKINKKAVALYNQGVERAQDGNLPLAAGLFLKAIETDSKYLDAYLTVANIYGELKNYKTSIEYYEKAFAMDPEYSMEGKLSYSVSLAGSGEFEKALNAINELIEKRPTKNERTSKLYQYRKRCYEFAVDYAKKNGGRNYVFAPKNLGSAVNTTESEYFPSLSLDGKELVFTRRINDYNEDFYYSKRKSDTEWSDSKPMEGEVNTPMNEAAQNISQDGQLLVFTANARPEGFGGFDIYMSNLTPQGWGPPINAGGKIKYDQWDSQPCLSPDKKDLYFASRRFGGYGGSDIYVSHMQTKPGKSRAGYQYH